MTCAKLWLDQIIIFDSRVTLIFIRLWVWSHKLFVKWDPEHHHEYVNLSIFDDWIMIMDKQQHIWSISHISYITHIKIYITYHSILLHVKEKQSCLNEYYWLDLNMVVYMTSGNIKCHLQNDFVMYGGQMTIGNHEFIYIWNLFWLGISKTTENDIKSIFYKFNHHDITEKFNYHDIIDKCCLSISKTTEQWHEINI